MSTRRSTARSHAGVPKSRWAAYATAAAATAVAAFQSAEAEITYAIVNRPFADTNPGGSGGVDLASFGLEGSAYFVLFHGRNSNVGGQSFNLAGFYLLGGASAMFRGTAGPSDLYAARLGSGVNVSMGNFVSNAQIGSFAAALAYHRLGGNSYGNFLDPGIGFIGFKFDSGAGTKYGWIRLQMNGGAKGNTFTLIDYAYADVGEAIATGQIPEPNSLAFLAFGGVGLLVWRKWRARGTEKNPSAPAPSSTF